jgi:hypothetical protein
VDLDGFTYAYLRRPDEARRRLDLLGRQPLSGPEGSRQRVRAQPYRHLAKVLREMGYERESRETRCARAGKRSPRDFQYTPKIPTFVVSEDASIWLRAPSLQPCFQFIVFLTGWLLVSLGYCAGLMVPVSELAKPGPVTRFKAAQLSPMLSSLDVLLPIHAFGQEVNWWPAVENWNCAFAGP